MIQNQGTYSNYKFGGASNSGSYEDTMRTIGIVEKTPKTDVPLLVFSAKGKDTSRLRNAYDMMLRARDSQGKHQARQAMDQILNDHLMCVESIFQQSANAPQNGLIPLERSRISEHMSFLGREVERAFDFIKTHSMSDPGEKAKAIIESIGERLMTTCLMGPVFRVHGFNTIMLPALDFMKASESHQGSNTNAILHWAASLMAFKEHYGMYITHLSMGVAVTSDTTALGRSRTVIITEGFIATNDMGETMTLGTDNSDLSKVFLAWARRQMANGSATGRPVATLWKVIDPTMVLRGQTIEDLFELHPDLVSPTAIEAAIKYHVDIAIGNIRTGIVKTYGPVSW